ncbi:MAG TPA: hypothetical protein VFI42_00840 [Thermomicrobiaceae bacterium]|nr:hypothetical protein [Thermomicrobiaceae bacterium]
MLVNIELQQLRCLKQSDGSDGANPYLWVMLLQIDDDTIASGNAVFVADRPPSPVGASVLIQGGMRAGDSAPIPELLARLNARFRTDPPLARRDLILLALLMDERGTPGAAIVAGYNTFLTTVPEDVSQHLLELASPNSDDRNAAINAIQIDVHDKVYDAIMAQLNPLEEVEAGLGMKDRMIANAFQVFDQVNASRPFTLHFQSKSGGDIFEIDAQIRVTNDPCEDELLNLLALQTAIQNAQGAGKQLANTHGGELTGAQQQQLEQIKEEIRQLQQKVQTGERALARCRKGIAPEPANPVP